MARARIGRAFYECASDLANAATTACHTLYFAAINKLPNHRTLFDARQILLRQVFVQTAEQEALETSLQVEFRIHSRIHFNPRRPVSDALHRAQPDAKKTRLAAINTTFGDYHGGPA